MTPPPHFDFMARLRFLRELQRSGMPVAYLHNLLLALDAFTNAVLGGDPNETISSRLGKLQRAHHGKIPWSRPLARAVADLLDAIAASHCRQSIRRDRGERALLNFVPPPRPRRRVLDKSRKKSYARKNVNRKAGS